MSKFIVANLTSALVLMVAGSVFADPAESTASTAQSPAEASAPAAQTTDTATTAAAPASKPAPAAKKKPSPDDVICKADSGTGSRVGGKKICLTRAQWRERED